MNLLEEHYSDATEFVNNAKLSKAQKDPNYQYKITSDELKASPTPEKKIIYVSLNAIKEYDDPDVVKLFETLYTEECESTKLSSELTDELREIGA